MSGLKDILKSFSPVAQVKDGAVEIITNLANKGADLFGQVQEGKITIEQAKIELEKYKIEAESKSEQNITDRWVVDTNSDSKAAKNIRPYSLASLLIFAFILAFTDSTGLNFEVKEEWISLFKELLMIAFLAYFGGRTLEKIRK